MDYISLYYMSQCYNLFMILIAVELQHRLCQPIFHGPEWWFIYDPCTSWITAYTMLAYNLWTCVMIYLWSVEQLDYSMDYASLLSVFHCDDLSEISVEQLDYSIDYASLLSVHHCDDLSVISVEQLDYSMDYASLLSVGHCDDIYVILVPVGLRNRLCHPTYSTSVVITLVATSQQANPWHQILLTL